jgi:hypothetical protein
MVMIEYRYRGPAASGNGGWSAGTVAGLLDVPAGSVVTLRVPPPLDTELSVVRTPDAVTVHAPDGTLVAEAAPAVVDADPVPPVDFAAATRASRDFPGLRIHPFPTCFVCGTDRAEGDGLRLFPGPVAPDVLAAAWRVPADVSPAMVWAVLDCPGGWAVGHEERPHVLGRIAARTGAVPAPGDECVVMGRLLAQEGRKAMVATTLYSPAGDLMAQAQATWVALARD